MKLILILSCMFVFVGIETQVCQAQVCGCQPVVTYYAPPTTTYYAPATVSYYAPATYTTYYAPPTTTYYAAPTTAYYAPVTYAPTTAYYAPVGRPGLFGWRWRRQLRDNLYTVQPY